jgi:hypothetical protein
MCDGGADRQLIENPPGDRIWQMYPPGWRQDAYRLIEENLVPDISDEDGLFEALDLINDYDVAQQVQCLIEPHVGPHHILHCALYEIGTTRPLGIDDPEAFMGYDVAYPGGDLFSAVAFGMFEVPVRMFDHPEPELIRRYKHLTNRYGLYAHAERRRRIYATSRPSSQARRTMISIVGGSGRRNVAIHEAQRHEHAVVAGMQHARTRRV